jgi:hypothetical protein
MCPVTEVHDNCLNNIKSTSIYFKLDLLNGRSQLLNLKSIQSDYLQ